MMATRFPVRVAGGRGSDPALFEGTLDDRQLDLFDRDRVGVDVEHASGLARRRAEFAGELGKIVRRMQPFGGLLPVVAVDEVVPLRDQVAERAAGLAEGNPAIHAARRLALDQLGRRREIDLVPVPQPLRHRSSRRQLAINFQESAWISHSAPRQGLSPPVAAYPARDGIRGASL